MWTLRNECGLVTLQNVRNVSNVTYNGTDRIKI